VSQPAAEPVAVAVAEVRSRASTLPRTGTIPSSSPGPRS
jgi:hypothetical protein